MTLPATLESNKVYSNERTALRKTLRLATSARLTSREGTQVQVHDLSVGGLLIESPDELRIGESLAVELPRSGPCEAVIVWSSSCFYGCRFVEPLPPAAISAALLKALPVAGQPPRFPSAQDAFSARLTTLRELRGWSVEELAAKLNVSRQAVWYWETGQRLPRPGTLSRLAKQLNVNENELLEPEVHIKPATSDDLALWRHQIADRFGITSEQVKILIEL